MVEDKDPDGVPLQAIMADLARDRARKDIRRLLVAINDLARGELLQIGPIPVGSLLLIPLHQQRDAIQIIGRYVDCDLPVEIGVVFTSCPLTGACLPLNRQLATNRIKVELIRLEESMIGSQAAAREYGSKVRTASAASAESLGNQVAAILCEAELINPFLAAYFQINPT